MKLIFDRGLNCQLACIITIAGAMGVPYQNAYSTLWSETDFCYDLAHQVYVSKRLIVNLKALGIELEYLPCTTEDDRGKSLTRFSNQELFVAGMDHFHIPWHPVYQHFHGPHYFFARNEDAPILPCFDPVYGQDQAEIAVEVIQRHAYDLVSVKKTAEAPLKNTVWQEARAVLRTLPELEQKLLPEIQACAQKEPEHIRTLIKRMDALMNNRYLFQQYLRHASERSDSRHAFFDKNFLSQWEAVKNGLYKAFILKDNRAVVAEVCGIFQDLMRQEKEMAEQIVMLR